MISSHIRAQSLRAAYIGVVLLATLTHLEFSPELHAAHYRLMRAFTLSLSWRDAVDGFRNAVLFAGLGVVWVLTSSGRTTREGMRRVALAGVILSTVVEMLQVFSPERIASILDVTTDSLGTLAGAAVLLFAMEQSTRECDGSVCFGIPVTMLCAPYLLAVTAEALTPLFASAPVTVVGGPATRLAATLSRSIRLSSEATSVSDLWLYFPAGVLAFLLVRGRGWNRHSSALAVAILGSVTIAAVHIAHGAAGLPISWRTVAMDVLGLTVGTWAAQRWTLIAWRQQRPIQRDGAILSYMLVLAAWAWRPFRLEIGAHAIVSELLTGLMPLRALSERVDLFSAAHTAQQCLLYMPLGALHATRDTSSLARWRHLVIAAVFAVALEFGHLLIAARTFDITNILLAWAGLMIGWVVIRSALGSSHDHSLRDALSRDAECDVAQFNGERERQGRREASGVA